jgi:hypothetical protein
MIPVALMVVGSPLTVAGAAAALSVAMDAPHSLDQPLRALPLFKLNRVRKQVKQCGHLLARDSGMCVSSATLYSLRSEAGLKGAVYRLSD